jgi:hypothetical protein
MPNPWDVGSARLLAGLGFPALATTSSGFAWSAGRPDNHAGEGGVGWVSAGGEGDCGAGTFAGLAEAVPFAEIDGAFDAHP